MAKYTAFALLALMACASIASVHAAYEVPMYVFNCCSMLMHLRCASAVSLSQEGILLASRCQHPVWIDGSWCCPNPPNAYSFFLIRILYWRLTCFLSPTQCTFMLFIFHPWLTSDMCVNNLQPSQHQLQQVLLLGSWHASLEENFIQALQSLWSQDSWCYPRKIRLVSLINQQWWAPF